MTSNEPDLDDEGRPRHDDPRDHGQPIAPERKITWLPWLLVALAAVVVAILLMGP